MNDMRGYPPEPQGFYVRFFTKGRGTVRHGRRLRAHHELRDIADAKHAILHTPDGRALLRDTGADIDELAAHLLEASEAARVRNATNKREDNMNTDTAVILKNIRNMGEAEYVKIVTKYAKLRHPELTPERAFAKIFLENSEEGRALRTLHGVAKGSPLSKDDGCYDGGPLDDDGYYDGKDDEYDAPVADDPMELLNRLAAALRSANPSWSQEKAFTKAYEQNPDLARRERKRAYARMGV